MPLLRRERQKCFPKYVQFVTFFKKRKRPSNMLVDGRSAGMAFE
jgi:hypothetical protein